MASQRTAGTPRIEGESHCRRPSLADQMGILSYIENRRRRREFESATEAELRLLLRGLPGGWFEKLINAYPYIWSDADEAFAKGENPCEAASRIAVALITGLIRKHLPPDSRASLLRELQRWASEPDRKKRVASAPQDLWLPTIIVLEAQSHQRIETGQLEPVTQQWMMNEVLGALANGTNRSSRGTPQQV